MVDELTFISYAFAHHLHTRQQLMSSWPQLLQQLAGDNSRHAGLQQLHQLLRFLRIGLIHHQLTLIPFWPCQST
jgi:hypothetical protein